MITGVVLTRAMTLQPSQGGGAVGGGLYMVLMSHLENPFQLEGCILAARTTWKFSLQGLLAMLRMYLLHPHP